MKKYLLPENGKFYKANMHSHSTYSDGKLTPQELKESYKAQGYSVLAITDHEAIFDHSYLNDDDFLIIPGYERSVNQPAEEWNDVLTCHMCFYPKDPEDTKCIAFNPDHYVHPKIRWMHDPELERQVSYHGEPYYNPVYSAECVNHIIAEATKYNYLVTVNHLWWSQERYEQFSQYKGMGAIEIYNHMSAMEGLDIDNGFYYDSFLRLGNRIRCVATDDNHRAEHRFGGWIMIKAPALDHKTILGAFERGEYYSSNGPEINEFYIEDGIVHITTSKAKKIHFITGNRYTKLAVPQSDDGYITAASFNAKKISGYFRVEVTDEFGKKAYTNACFADEL